MAKKRIFDDHTLSQTERNRRHADKACSIDDELNQALQAVDLVRRQKGSSSLLEFIRTYCVGLLMDHAPSGHMIDVIDQLERSITNVTPTLMCCFRGMGKSSALICLLIYVACCKGDLHKYSLIVSLNQRSSASMIKDALRMITEPGTAFALDYPEICLPYALGGNGRRRQTYNGISTDISRTSNTIVLPRIVFDDGSEPKSSGCCISAKPLGSARGSRHGKYRVSLCCIDDISTLEIATNSESVQKQMDLITKDLMNLGGLGRKINILMTATAMSENDIVDRISHNPQWKTIKYQAILKYPDDMIQDPENGHWALYFKLFDDEILHDQSHMDGKSMAYIKDHYKEMHQGAEVFNDYYCIADGHISALLKFLEKRHTIGTTAFDQEMLNVIQKDQFALSISAPQVMTKLNQYNKYEIPDDYRYVTIGIDLNTSYAISLVCMAWKPDTTGIVVWHLIFNCLIDQKLPDTSYNQAVYDHLSRVTDRIKSLNLHPSAIAIDCGGRNWDAVNLFCRQNVSKDLPLLGFAGRSSTQFLPLQYTRVRLKDAVAHTVLCGDEKERSKPGSGIKYCYFDADWCKYSVQSGLNCIPGDVGSISIWHTLSDDHREFAILVSNERIRSITHKANGLDVYTWASKNPHDLLDCCSMCVACLGQLGISASNFTKKKPIRPIRTLAKRQKVKFV